MELYFAPLACSMASRITLYEIGAKVDYIQVNTRTKKIHDGRDFLAVNPLGMVPALRLNDGSVLLENAAVLQYLADRFPEAGLAPESGSPERYQLQQWLNFITTELHKAIYVPLLDRNAPAEMKAYVRSKLETRHEYLAKHLTGRTTLLDRFSVADIYLFTVLNWGRAMAVDLNEWPAIRAFYDRMRERPAAARALGEELELYTAEQTQMSKVN